MASSYFFFYFFFSFLLLLLLLLWFNEHFFSKKKQNTSSSNLSSSTHQARHDVFISFRGEDTRVGFTSHLHAALEGKQILTYIDDYLERGEEISPSLLKAIDESKLSVIVFSENYASSKWCLDELVKIFDCKKKGQIVIPVFYHVDPSDVRNRTGSFGDAFAKLLKGTNLEVGRVRRWREALKEAADLSGWTSRDYSPESEFIKKIVRDILKKLHEISSISNHMGPVGIDARIKKIESLLNIDEPQDIRIVGLWGMGGIGKTTIARAVFSNIRNHFEGVFFTNLRKELEKHSMIDLQRTFLAQLLGREILNMGFVSFENSFMMDRLRRKKVLIVLDDVHGSTQLQEFQELLIQQRDSFCPGSRIIVTSRDKQVLRNVVDENRIYDVEGLDDHEALRLFSLKAFKSCSAPVDYADLSERIVKYAKGNPLALTVVGSALYGKSKEYWDSAINKLGKVSNPEIEDALRISYDDGLDRDQQNIFLDIAFFLNGTNRDVVTESLECWYSSVPSDITILADKSLITIRYDNMVEVHDSLREMAFNIEKSKNPWERSRLYDEEVYRALKNKKGIDSIKGVSLDLSKSKEMHLESNAFEGMDNLRFLIFYGDSKEKVQLPHCGLVYLPPELRYFRWDGFPSKSWPTSFCAENLVELDFRESEIEKLWTGVQNLVNLRELDLGECTCLIELPDLSKASNLGRLDLSFCESITEVPSHIQYLPKLEYLCFINCGKLTSIPRRIDSKLLRGFVMSDCINIFQCPEIYGDIEELWLDGTAVGQVPQSMSKCKRLTLDCCWNITEFPHVPGNTTYLNLSSTAIVEVPSSIAVLMQLNILEMSYCEQLSSLPSSIWKLKSLEKLNLYGCCKLGSIPEIMDPMEFLTELDLGETVIAELPSSVTALTRLATLRMRSCKKLSSLPSSIWKLKSLVELDVYGCCKLGSIPEIMDPMEFLTKLDLGETAIAELPSSITALTRLATLRMTFCKQLASLPSIIWTLKSLEKLDVYGCCKLESIPGIMDPMEFLTKLDLGGTAIAELPSSITAFTRLTKLRMTSCKQLSSLPSIIWKLKSLEMLDVYGCCKLGSIPEIMDPMEFLTELDLGETAIAELPSSATALTQLATLRMSSCKQLLSLPSNIWKLKSLVKLDVYGCCKLKSISEIMDPMGFLIELDLGETAIAELPSSITALTRLAKLRMTTCKQLLSLPSIIWKLKSLKELDVYGCCKLESIPEIMDPMKFLTKLDLSETAIAELPSSITALTRLATLRMRSCKQLSSLPSSIWKLKSLVELDVYGCCKLESIPEIMDPMEFLKYLDLGETAIVGLPSSIKHQKSLRHLKIQGTPVTHLSELPPCLENLGANDCESLETVWINNLEPNFMYLNFANCFKLDQKAPMAALQHKIQVFNESRKLEDFQLFILVGSEIPEWFSDQCVGHSITMRWPINSHQLKGIVFFLVFAFSDLSNDLPEEFLEYGHGSIKFICHEKNNNGWHVHGFSSLTRCVSMKLCEADHMLLWYEDFFHHGLNQYSGNDVTFEFYPKEVNNICWTEGVEMHEILKRCEVKKCGVYLDF